MSELLEAIEKTAQEVREAYGMNPGTLPPARPYEWITLPGNLVRPRCRAHGLVMKWAMKMSKDYPDTVNKHTRQFHAHPVVYKGLPIQIYKCPHAGCEVEAVK